MVMNIYMLFFLSLPEAVLNLIIMLLFAGSKGRLKINKANILRFTISIVLMLTASWFIRPASPNIITSVILHQIAYVLIILVVYRLKFTYILLAVSFTYLASSTMENAYTPYIITYICNGIESFQNAYHWYVLYCLPTRAIQIASAVFLWRYDIMVATRLDHRFHKNFISCALILVSLENAFAFIFYTYWHTMSLIYQTLYSVSILLMVFGFNFAVFKLLYDTIGGIISKGYRQYTELEESARYAFDKIETLLQCNKINEAVELIQEIKGKEK
ncbi:hypothetical protein DFR58_1163 [Anaerobacterium chartisolvens]|uniref:Uncharacterized protein n=1 Tax=Anaerobacterium chartisolvens TaxID=1297424 RepID=A0A369AXF7_9FIRM|nr:hypothetical protein [Anaerobacterium chartisolvens]RCX13775.1 hypothetical protein DFR58_1163 [Anaerobacterium chartisolvens]